MDSCRRFPQQRRALRAFSLLELLVVVVIIALLAAILLPTLAKVREQGRLAVCRSNLHQVATAMNTYAGPRDSLLPGDHGMGHDIWNRPDEGPDAGSPCRPVNLGHLLQTRALPMPQSEAHPFYCPSLSRIGARWSFTYRNSGPFASTAPRGFEGWGQHDRTVNIGYEYRDTVDGASDHTIRPLASHHSGVADRALVSDVFSWGTAQWAHQTVYNYSRGDGSVGTYKDQRRPRYLYDRFSYYTSSRDDVLMFQLYEHPARLAFLFP